LFFFIRRVFIIGMILGIETLIISLRLIIFYWANILAIIYVFGWKRMETKKENNINLFNETCFWLMMLLMMMFTDYISDKEMQYTVGYLFVYLVWMNLSINLLIVIYDIFTEI